MLLPLASSLVAPRLVRFSLLAWLFSAALYAQTAPSTVDNKPKDFAANVAAKKRQAALDGRKLLQERAKLLRAEAEKSRDPKKAREASVEEAFILAKLVSGEDKAQRERRRKLVTAIARDNSVSSRKRFELSAISANAEIAVDSTLSRSERMAKFAEIAWQLTRDFPENPQGYNSLVFIARDSAERPARAIIAKLLTSSAPEKTKDAAKDLLQKLEARSTNLLP